MGVEIDDAKQFVAANQSRMIGGEEPEDLAHGLLETAQRRAELLGYGVGGGDLTIAGLTWCLLPNIPTKNHQYEEYIQSVRPSLFVGGSTKPEVLSRVAGFFSPEFLSAQEHEISSALARPPEWRRILNIPFLESLAAQGIIRQPPGEGGSLAGAAE